MSNQIKAFHPPVDNFQPGHEVISKINQLDTSCQMSFWNAGSTSSSWTRTSLTRPTQPDLSRLWRIYDRVELRSWCGYDLRWLKSSSTITVLRHSCSCSYWNSKLAKEHAFHDLEYGIRQVPEMVAAHCFIVATQKDKGIKLTRTCCTIEEWV